VSDIDTRSDPVDRVETNDRLPARISMPPAAFWRLIYRPRTFTTALRQRYGEMATLHIGGEHYALALGPEAARQVLLASPDGYSAFWKQSFTGLTGPGSLWVLEGARHRRERQLLGPAFHERGFSGYGQTIREITREHTEAWRPGLTIRALDTTLSISMDVILRLVFGVEDEKFMQQGRVMLSTARRATHPLVVFFPGLQKPWFPLWRSYIRTKSQSEEFVRRHLANRRALTRQPDDILGRMLAARYEDGSRMRDEAIFDELWTILGAGHETTATALAWALYELGRNRAELRALRAEVESLGPDPAPVSIVKLPYLSAVCNETLRLHTILAEVARVLDSPLRVMTYDLPAGHSVIVSIESIHHDPRVFPEPDAFIPERFLERDYGPFEFLPFGGGHRRCLGAAFSDFELRIALAEIVTRWDFETTAAEREIRHDIAMGPKHGVPLRITGRREPINPLNIAEPATASREPRAPELI
jgi:cytochrome P450